MPPDRIARPESLAEILDHVDQAFCVVDPDLTLAFVNRRLATLLRLPDELMRPGAAFRRFVDHKRRIGLLRGAADEVFARWTEWLSSHGTSGECVMPDGRTFRYRITVLSGGGTMIAYEDVTRAQVHKRELEDRQRQFKEILGQIAEGVNIVDSDMRLVVANGGFLEMFDFPEALATPGTPFSDFVRHRLERGEYVTEFEREGTHSIEEMVAAREELFRSQPVGSEIVAVEQRLNGRWIEWRRRRSPENYFVTTYADVTERVESAAALQESEARYRVVVEDQTEMISRYDPDLKLTFANRAYWQAFNDGSDDILGKSFVHHIMDEEMREALPRELAALTPEDPAVTHLLRERHTDGTIQWHEWRNRAQFDSERRIIGYQAIGRNVTAEKEAIDALTESKQARDAIVDAALDCIITIDAQSIIQEFNPAAERVFGFSREEAVGRALTDLIIPPEHRASHQNGMARYLAGGESRVIGRRLELEGLRADRTRMPIEVSVAETSIRGAPTFVAYLRDLTETKRVQDEIERQRIALAQNDKMSALGSVLASVSHELNNPLAVVVGQAELLADITENEKVRERLERIRSAANRCARIVRTFLSVARQKPPEQAPFQINTVIAEAMDLVEYSLSTSGIDPIVAFEDELPQLFGDAFQLSQVIVNLLVNAQQALATKPAPRMLAVRTRRSFNGREVVIHIADNGPGIPDELKRRVFEPFFTTKGESTGTGIGLAISHNIVAAHGGQLLLRDTPGGGATFEIRMPVPDHMAIAPEPSEPRVARQRSHAALKVLIVDDEIEIANTMSDYLTGDGHDCQIATGGKAALALLKRDRFDAVISDIRMPDLDGPALFRAAGELPETPVFAFMTGDTLGPAAADFLRETDRPHVEKPFRRDQVLSLVEHIAELVERGADEG